MATKKVNALDDDTTKQPTKCDLNDNDCRNPHHFFGRSPKPPCKHGVPQPYCVDCHDRPDIADLRAQLDAANRHYQEAQDDKDRRKTEVRELQDKLLAERKRNELADKMTTEAVRFADVLKEQLAATQKELEDERERHGGTWDDLHRATERAEEAEEQLKPLRQGPFVPLRQYDNVVKQRAEEIEKRRKAERDMWRDALEEVRQVLVHEFPVSEHFKAEPLSPDEGTAYVLSMCGRDLTEERDAERKRADALEAFKAYVHKRLDDAGVPKDPESPHKAAGCRIGGRLDHVLKAQATAEALRAALETVGCTRVRNPDIDSPCGYCVVCEALAAHSKAVGP
jgi:hypothetical protein